MLVLGALAVGQIVRHPPLDIRPFPVQVALGLENGAADQGVQPAADFGNPLLEIERAQFDPEFRDEQLPEIGLDPIMARAAWKVRR
jgi:hypothetical protein